MVSIFRDKSPVNVFWLIGLSILLHAHFFVSPPQVLATTDDGFISGLLIKYIAPLPAFAIAALYHITVIMQALRLNYILNDIKMFQRPAFTTAMAYVLFTALLPEWNHLSAALVTNNFIIWLIYLIARLYNSPHPKSLIYNIGFIAGLAVAGYYPSLPIIIVAYFALAVLRPFRANEWFILLMGIITPFYFLAAWLFMGDQIVLMRRYIPVWQPHIIHLKNLKGSIIAFASLGVSIITGILIWQSNNGRMLIQARRTWGVLLVMLFLFIPILFIIKGLYLESLLLAFVPAAAFAANFFLYPRGVVIPAILFWLYVGLIVYNNWFVLKN